MKRWLLYAYLIFAIFAVLSQNTLAADEDNSVSVQTMRSDFAGLSLNIPAADAKEAVDEDYSASVQAMRSEHRLLIKFPDGIKVLGWGFFISTQHLLTCAHYCIAVEAGNVFRATKICLLLNEDEELESDSYKVYPEYLQHPRADRGFDLAVITLKTALRGQQLSIITIFDLEAIYFKPEHGQLVIGKNRLDCVTANVELKYDGEAISYKTKVTGSEIGAPIICAPPPGQGPPVIIGVCTGRKMLLHYGTYLTDNKHDWIYDILHDKMY